jgi:hypothetical protein
VLLLFFCLDFGADGPNLNSIGFIVVLYNLALLIIAWLLVFLIFLHRLRRLFLTTRFLTPRDVGVSQPHLRLLAFGEPRAGEAVEAAVLAVVAVLGFEEVVDAVEMVLDVEVEVVIVLRLVLFERAHLEDDFLVDHEIEGDLTLVSGFDGDIELWHIEGVVTDVEAFLVEVHKHLTETELPVSFKLGDVHQEHPLTALLVSEHESAAQFLSFCCKMTELIIVYTHFFICWSNNIIQGMNNFVINHRLFKIMEIEDNNHFIIFRNSVIVFYGFY